MRELSNIEIDAVGGGQVARQLLEEFVKTTAWTVAYEYLKAGWQRVTYWVSSEDEAATGSQTAKDYQALSYTGSSVY